MDLQQSEAKQNDDLKDSLINDSLPDYNGSSQQEGENSRSVDQIQKSKLDSMSEDPNHELDYLIDFRDEGYKKYYDELLRIQSEFTKERANFLQATGIDKPVQLAIRTTFNDKTRYDQIKQLKQDAYEIAKDNQAFRKQLEFRRRQLKLIEMEIQAHESVKGQQQKLLSRPIDSQEGLKHISPQKIQSQLQRIMTADSSNQLEKMRPYFEVMIKHQRQKGSKTASNVEQMERNLRFYQEVLEKYENSRNTENEDDQVRKIEILIQNQLSTQKHLEKYIQRADTDIKFYQTKLYNNNFR